MQGESPRCRVSFSVVKIRPNALPQRQSACATKNMLTVAQIAPLKDRDPYLYETLTKIVAAVNATGQSAGVDSSTPSPAPSPIASVTVQASNGWFDISITDPSASRPGLFYFAESDTAPSFNTPRVYFMGAS